jgi:hypothetical protein
MRWTASGFATLTNGPFADMVCALFLTLLARFLALHRNRPQVQMISEEEANTTNAEREAVMVVGRLPRLASMEVSRG